MKRNYSLDLLRVFLCVCVITSHSINYFDIEGEILHWLITFLIQTDGIFYMLSGYFNLDKEFNNSSDIKKYYKNKVINVLLPFVAYLIFWGCWDYMHENGSFDVLGFLWYFYELIMETASTGHLWFLYPLFGLLLSTPFFSKMLHNMNEKELKILWCIGIGWNILECYLCWNVGISFSYICWILDGWPFLYFTGYYYKYIISREKKSKWFIIGLIAFVLTNVGKLYVKYLAGSADVSITYLIFCIACLMFWDKSIRINNEKIQKIIVFLSSNTFMIYLFHMRGLEYVTRKLSIINGGIGVGLLIVLLTFIISLIASIAVKNLLKPIQKLINNIWIIE